MRQVAFFIVFLVIRFKGVSRIIGEQVCSTLRSRSRIRFSSAKTLFRPGANAKKLSGHFHRVKR
ncbi:hypothetical protein Pcar_3286 [Syntrophotalea carbinolica DSM 2380]|uniref:Uncharacterized protein n=1 Tax=Syntrophotalea carbinolica (strain DSM 2380 / NBRC 103641 / GraBd1) TaxID=338963 RepID=Q0C6N2_SYNC1|nr:hypothetical protein Pcar_3286 [Syntrophotalea carbinolica DSM 2380]